jgi:hypothetical protein
MTKRKYLKYSIKVWLSSTMLPPLVLQLLSILLHPGRSNDLPFDLNLDLLIPYLIGLFVTIPYFLAFTVAVRQVDNTKLNLPGKKLALVLLNAVAITAHFVALFQALLSNEMVMLLAYLLLSSMSVIAFRINDKNESIADDTTC